MTQLRSTSAADLPRASDAELKARHRAAWASGIAPGMRVLDVAAGTGNASLPAARP